ncbi:hypothetical protein CIT292_06872 [Citrobacter youngae ATCC 29220]|uniref:Uncharacterized protein n=1 Tax=Citrobacter youngae ATCC 29220 TaxID=500640 RepID=D4B8T4_9ENTR|nr:hypothetical protein CIT292_06872 [Citrobacter youngae ATCC 29220]
MRFISNKRELVNKFVKCIGGEETHLVLSGQVFCRRFHVDENNFQLVSLNRITTCFRQGRHVDNRRKAVIRIARINKVGDSKQ